MADELKNKTQLNAASRRLSSKDKCRVKSEGIKEDTPSKWEPNKANVAILIISNKNKLQAKKQNKRQRWTIYDKGDNSSRRHYDYSHICI